MPHDHLKLREYTHWDLYLHVKQFPYIGRAYAWLKRPEEWCLMQVLSEEWAEFHARVEKDWDHAITEAFGCDLPNVFHGNNRTKHVHGHLIPRYEHPVEFEGITFEDKNWEKHYKPYEDRPLEDKIILAIKDRVLEHLPARSRKAFFGPWKTF